MSPHADPRPVHCSGFSLIEMLVALAVFALAVLALLNLSAENTRSALLAEQRVLAGVVADNHAVEAMLVPAGELADAGGNERNGDRDWTWLRTRSVTDDGLLIVVVQVRDPASGQLLAERRLLRNLP